MHQIVLKKRKSLSIFFSVLAIGSAVYLGIAYSKQVKAGPAESSAGFAWGGGAAINGSGYDGIGWIGANNLSDGSGVNYGVNIPSADGSLSGYGWSEHYGWLSFNAADLTGCPGGACTATRSGNALSGWARFIAIRDAGSNSGGWSGWVSLSGTAQDSSFYGVGIAGNALSGYAWSDELGWIDFSGVTISPTSTLKICEDTCTGGLRRDTLPDFSMDTGAVNSRTLYACIGTGSCSVGDVPVSVTWAEDSTTDPSYSDAIVRTPVTNPTPFITITGNANGKEKITAYDGTNTVDAVASVSCNPVEPVCASADAQNTCTGQQYTMSYTDTCTLLTTTKRCNGTRYCDFNWREVAP